MHLLAASGVFIGFAILMVVGIVLAVAKGSLWVLLLAIALFFFGFIRFGCLDHP